MVRSKSKSKLNEQLGVRIMKIEFRVWDKNKRKMLYLYPNDTILFN